MGKGKSVKGSAKEKHPSYHERTQRKDVKKLRKKASSRKYDSAQKTENSIKKPQQEIEKSPKIRKVKGLPKISPHQQGKQAHSHSRSFGYRDPKMGSVRALIPVEVIPQSKKSQNKIRIQKAKTGKNQQREQKSQKLQKTHQFQKSKKSKSKSQDIKFTTLNTTNVQIVKKYFETISPSLFDTMARSGQFVLYQAEGEGYEIFLVPSEISPLIKQLNKNFPLMYAGIPLGFMKRQQTRTRFERQFFLSFEGGRFLWKYIQSYLPEIKNELQSVILDEDGEKAFFYGRNIEMDDVISETEKLVKKKITFVLDQNKEYIGLALLMVKQAGTEKPVLGIKTRDLYSRSPNFKLNLLNLSDGGKYLRKGS
ncbi:MAG: hypothetical protein K9W44_18340 [Candidatus Lokiarchaeota archaeon]|nr:hypothetical protein [Candidatus Harpocratesius repetitus]